MNISKSPRLFLLDSLDKRDNNAIFFSNESLGEIVLPISTPIEIGNNLDYQREVILGLEGRVVKDNNSLVFRKIIRGVNGTTAFNWPCGMIAYFMNLKKNKASYKRTPII
jgi:hypothetical protein